MVSLTSTKGSGHDQGRPAQRGREANGADERGTAGTGTPASGGAAGSGVDGGEAAGAPIDFTTTLLSFLPLPEIGPVEERSDAWSADMGGDGRGAITPPATDTLSPALLAAVLAVAEAWRDHLLPLLDSLDADPWTVEPESPSPSGLDGDGDGEDDGRLATAAETLEAGTGDTGAEDAAIADAGMGDAGAPLPPSNRRIGDLVDRLRALYDVDGELVEYIGERPRLGVFRLHIRRRGFTAEIANTAHLYDGMLKATIAEATGPTRPISIAQALRIADREVRRP